MALVKCKECGAMISSSAKMCPQCGKKKESYGCLIVLLILILPFVIVFAIMSTPGQPRSATNTDSTSTVATDTETEVTDYSDTIAKLKKSGLLISVNPSMNEAKVNVIKWYNLDIEVKEQVGMVLAFYCGQKKGTNLNWVEIKNPKTGKVLAKYSQRWGFKLY